MSAGQGGNLPVAERLGIQVLVASNSVMAIPSAPWIKRVIVSDASDAADDLTAERAGPGAIVVTADVPLAARAVKTGATVIAPNGRLFTPDSIGMARASRKLMGSLRSAGQITGGPKPFASRDRSTFLSVLGLAINRLKRAAAGAVACGASTSAGHAGRLNRR